MYIVGQVEGMFGRNGTGCIHIAREIHQQRDFRGYTTQPSALPLGQSLCLRIDLTQTNSAFRNHNEDGELNENEDAPYASGPKPPGAGKASTEKRVRYVACVARVEVELQLRE